MAKILNSLFPKLSQSQELRQKRWHLLFLTSLTGVSGCYNVPMQSHVNFCAFRADNNYDLGMQLGTHFRSAVQAKVNGIVRDNAWALKRKHAQEYCTITEEYFPQYVREIEGYAEGAGVDFLELWTRSLEDEFSYYRDEDHCTSIVTNEGKLISHNEDWARDAADQICVLQKTIGDLTILELNYWTSLGGNSASINSHGYVQLINTLTHSDWQMGVPRNVIARFLSETSDPVKDFEKLRSIRRAAGYNHNIIDLNGKIWNIESTSKRCVMVQPEPPFVHTNHYLSDQLKPYEAETGRTTFKRYEVATHRVKPRMIKQELIELTGDSSQGPDLSIFNERTIARMIIDLERKATRIWLAREAERGWVEYPLPRVESDVKK